MFHVQSLKGLNALNRGRGSLFSTLSPLLPRQTHQTALGCFYCRLNLHKAVKLCFLPQLLKLDWRLTYKVSSRRGHWRAASYTQMHALSQFRPAHALFHMVAWGRRSTAVPGFQAMFPHMLVSHCCCNKSHKCTGPRQHNGSALQSLHVGSLARVLLS